MKQTLTITGKVHEIRPEQKFSEKFRKQEVILDLMWDEKKSWTQYRSVEFINDEINKLTFQEGDVVSVEAEISGNYHEASNRYFNSDRVCKVEVLKPNASMVQDGDNGSLPF